MGDESGGPKDLFGDPWTPPRDPRGRKSHRRTPQVAERVGVLRALGHTVEDIALRLGLSEPTLRKYYFRELDQGSALAETVLDEKLWTRAMEGSVPAMRLLKEQLTKGKAAVPVKRQAKAEKLGKKEQASVDAISAHEGTSWADRLN